MKKFIRISCFASSCFFLPVFAALAAPLSPVLLYSDIVSGPPSGLNDGLGQGAIVTIWGHNLGSSQSSSELIFTDSNGTELPPSHIYYWKNADGMLPGGPANLFESHGMQEIAFSIPTTIIGSATIKVNVKGAASNSIPFRVAAVGDFWWVAPDGNNSNSCTFSMPCEYINADVNSAKGGVGNGRLSAGDIVYSRGVAEPDLCRSDGSCFGMYLRSINGTESNLISIVSYPGTRSQVLSDDSGFKPYLSKYISLHKYSIKVGDRDPSLAPNPGNPTESDQHITLGNGRYIGNYLGENAGTCINGWAGSIVSSKENGDGAIIYGNEIDDIGCENTSRYHHTTYLSVRDGNSILTKGWDFSYNYLHDNKAMFGIHFYDENYSDPSCAKFTGTLRVTNNVITNQIGSGINISTRDFNGDNICWETDIIIQNNLLINTGLSTKAIDDGIVPPGTAIRIAALETKSNFLRIESNTIINYGSDLDDYHEAVLIEYDPSFSPSIFFSNNSIQGSRDINYLVQSHNFEVAEKNLFYSTATTKPALPTTTQNNLTEDSVLTINGSKVSLGLSSSLKDEGYNNGQVPTHDIYGALRNTDSFSVGAIEYIVKPNPPSSLSIQ